MHKYTMNPLKLRWDQFVLGCFDDGINSSWDQLGWDQMGWDQFVLGCFGWNQFVMGSTGI